MLFHHFNNCDNATITLFTDHYLIFIYSTEDRGGPKQPTKDIHGFSIIDNCVKTKADPIPPPHCPLYTPLTSSHKLKIEKNNANVH